MWEILRPQASIRLGLRAGSSDVEHTHSSDFAKGSLRGKYQLNADSSLSFVFLGGACEREGASGSSPPSPEFASARPNLVRTASQPSGVSRNPLCIPHPHVQMRKQPASTRHERCTEASADVVVVVDATARPAPRPWSVPGVSQKEGGM